MSCGLCGSVAVLAIQRFQTCQGRSNRSRSVGRTVGDSTVDTLPLGAQVDKKEDRLLLSLNLEKGRSAAEIAEAWGISGISTSCHDTRRPQASQGGDEGCSREDADLAVRFH